MGVMRGSGLVAASWRGGGGRCIDGGVVFSAIARYQQRVERARCLALGTLGPAGLGGLVPGEDIAMQPRLGRADEAPQEQRGGNRAAEIAGGDVVDVGHLGIEQLVVGPP